jgi:uncharacterized membrane protein
MMAFHLCFDLQQFRLIAPQNFYEDPFWTGQRAVIVSLFLLCAGAGQSVALVQGQTLRRFWRRWAQVAGCALLVSAGSALMFPRSWISFGVLHGIALMLLLVRFTVRPSVPLWPLLAAGAVAIAVPQFVQHPAFDSRWTNWIGLVTHKPPTEDFVPLLPWLGPVLWGLAAGLWLQRRHRGVLAGAVPRAAAPLAWMGRHPLAIYMLHQPLFIGVLTLWRAISQGTF